MKRMLGLLAVLFALSLATMGAVDAQVEEDDLEAVASQEEAADTDDSAADTLSEVSPIETWEVVVALFIPLVVGFVNRAGWTSPPLRWWPCWSPLAGSGFRAIWTNRRIGRRRS
jgi:fatty acid desaturase